MIMPTSAIWEPRHVMSRQAAGRQVPPRFATYRPSSWAVRVPVRIVLTRDNAPKQVALLRAGLNVETKVRLK